MFESVWLFYYRLFLVLVSSSCITGSDGSVFSSGENCTTNGMTGEW